jgi:hypothetical protein
VKKLLTIVCILFFMAASLTGCGDNKPKSGGTGGAGGGAGATGAST